MKTLTRCKPMLGTYVTISLTADADHDMLVTASDAAFASMRAVHDAMSFHDPASELSRLNAAAFAEEVCVSAAMADVLGLALELSTVSNGIYDVTVARHLVTAGYLPRHRRAGSSGDWTAIRLEGNRVRFLTNLIIDLGGIAKGYAVDSAFDALAELPVLFEQVSVNAGGDLRMLDWRGKIATMREPGRWSSAKFRPSNMQDAALATSTPGKGSPSSQIFNPQTDRFLRESQTVSVFAPRCVLADALTKCLALAPERGDILHHFDAKVLVQETLLQ